MSKNIRKRQRNDNLLKLRIHPGGGPESRKTSPIRIAKEFEKATRSRCCYVRPKQHDFGQITEHSYHESSDAYNSVQSIERYVHKFSDQKGISAARPEKKLQLEELENILPNRVTKTTNYSQMCAAEVQHSRDASKFMTNSSDTIWQNGNSVQDVEDFIQETSRENPHTYSTHFPQNIRISDAPKIKTIAEKFSKFKRNNMELRRLDEKIVCLEYDVFNQNLIHKSHKPIQRMRAFFSIKPGYKDSSEEIPFKVKKEFKVMDEDLLNLTEKEIEIIDNNIEGNKTYLEDLWRILKQKQYIDLKKNKSSLDLKSLYEMARRASYCLNSDLSAVNFLSEAELQEIKELILNQCKSSVHGISRRKMEGVESNEDNGSLSGNILAELLRENAKIDVIK